MASGKRKRNAFVHRDAPAANGAETVYLGEFTIATGLPTPWIDGDGAPANPRMSGFVFRTLPIRGVFDATTGRMEGVRAAGSSSLATMAWGSDVWMQSEFLDMTPPPKILDLRGRQAMTEDMDSALTGAKVGDSETVFRLSLRDFIAFAAKFRRT